NCCARSSPSQAQKRRGLACPVLYRSGAPEGIRTPDPQIRSLVLYPAELPAPAVRRSAKARAGQGVRTYSPNVESSSRQSLVDSASQPFRAHSAARAAYLFAPPAGRRPAGSPKSQTLAPVL